MSTVNSQSVDGIDVSATYKRLLQYTIPFLSLFFISFFGFALFAISQPAFAVLMESFVSALEGDVVDSLYLIPAMCVGIALLRGIGGYLGNYYMGKAGAGV